MKKRLTSILIAIMFIAGLGMLAYPTIANQWNSYTQSRAITSYEQNVEELKPEDFTKEWDTAKKFNDALEENDPFTDVFGSVYLDMKESEYWKVLNVAGNGIMGYISIPSINVELAIYHGTEESVLQTGIGHVNGTKLPIGGEGNHTVLAGHRGLPSARLFTDIDQLVRGDKIYIHILDEVLAYEVDQILDMVDKDDTDTLNKAMSIEEGEDYITLFTCTPYGVNSHRLLVRGSRIEYGGEEELDQTITETMVEAVQNYYMIYLILGLAVLLLGIVILKFLINRKNKRTHNS